MKRKTRLKSKLTKSICELLNYFVLPETCLITVSEEEREGKTEKKVFEEIMAENFPYL